MGRKGELEEDEGEGRDEVGGRRGERRNILAV